MFRWEKKFFPRDSLSVKEKNFDTRFGFIHVQMGKKNFFPRDPPPPVKGKLFDTRFYFIHVQMEKKSFSRGNPPTPSKGKIVWHQIWLHTCSDGKKKIFLRDPPSKGKIFWHLIWLHTCLVGKKKIFPKGPPSVKGNFFDTRFGFIHVQMGKKNFSEGPPAPSKGKNFWHQIWLDTCSDREKHFFWRDPPLPAE